MPKNKTKQKQKQEQKTTTTKTKKHTHTHTQNKNKNKTKHNKTTKQNIKITKNPQTGTHNFYSLFKHKRYGVRYVG